jgi:DNA-directed RNA polymerase specialized sigma24 family protein
MEFYKLKKTDTLHVAGFTYVSPYEAEREKEERDEERNTRRASDKAWADRIDGLNHKSLDDLCGLHETLLLRAHAIYTGQPVAPLEQTTDARVLYLQRKYSLDFWTALFEYVTFKARTSRKHALLRPKVNGRGQSTGVTHAKDMDDYIQDLSMSMWEQVQHGDFRGFDEEGKPVNFLHYLNKCYDNCFSSAATKQFAADKISRKVHAKETRETEQKPVCDETEDQAPKRSHGWSNESVSDGWRFSPLDPEKNERMREIVDRLTRTYPGIAALLSQGLTKGEISDRLGVKYSKLTRDIRKAKDEIEAAGITKRDTGRVYRKPNKRATKPEVEEVAVV